MQRFYDKELRAIKKANRYRSREVFDKKLKDYASNDYLSLSTRKKLFKRACKKISKYKYHASKASALVNGYHPVHKEFEEYIAGINGFEKGIVAGSGFLANLSLFEALPRRGDLLIFDEEYHASGLMATKLNEANVVKFKHNDTVSLEKIIKENRYRRLIIAVEGVYSMSGDILKKEVFDIADKYNAILVVDEAHSVGTLGDNLLGIFEYFDIKPKANHIKMGTLGKALGSYGAYILCSSEIEEFLLNRAKAIIYATAPSPFDIALAFEGFLFIERNKRKLKKEIKKRKKEIKNILGIPIESFILKVDIKSSSELLTVKEKLRREGFLIGAIRPPTVKTPILRLIPRLKEKKFKKLLKLIKGIKS